MHGLRRVRPGWMLLFTMMLIVDFFQPAAAQQAGASQPGEVLIHFDEGINVDQAQHYFDSKGLSVLAYFPEIGVWHAAGQAVAGPALAAALGKDSQIIAWAEPNGFVQASGFMPDDAYFQAQQTHLVTMGFPDAWVFTAGAGVTIAVLDSGIDLDHPDLVDQVWSNALELPGDGLDNDANGFVDDVQGWDFVNQDAVAQDDFGHGSHVSAIAAARTNNAAGIAGTAWQSRVLPVKVLDSKGLGTWANVIAGIEYAVQQNARILNLSLGGADNSIAVQAAVDFAYAQGCLVVAAAGNSTGLPKPVDYPAAYDHAVAVAATDSFDFPWAFSNRGAQVDLAAPGVDIFSASAQGSYYTSSGTSMATPHVSGLAALLWGLDPGLTVSQVRDLMISSAHDVWTSGWDERSGWGRIDAYRAVLSLVQPVISLHAERETVRVTPDQTRLVAVVKDHLGSPVPDGVEVVFTSDSGILSPVSVLTQNSQVITTFTGTQMGSITVAARVGVDYQATTTIEVLPQLIYFPEVFR